MVNDFLSQLTIEAVAKKRISTGRTPSTIKTSIKQAVNLVPSNLPNDPKELRSTMLRVVNVWRETKELALTHVQSQIKAKSASERILGYLQLFPKMEIEGEELEIVSGISEYARRIREWRVEFGWPIKHENGIYVLESNEPDESKAELWRILNTIRRSGMGARDKMLALFRGLPIGTKISTSQLRYVTEGKDMRRVRELRTQFGWRIMTKKTGIPELRPDQYVLVNAEPMEEHDRDIETETVINVLTRDKHKCRKCHWSPSNRILGDPRQFIELHHMTWHVQGGLNEEDNLITLCNVHHQRVHALHLSREQLQNWLAQD